ncbi:10451_t:CDS:1, partial [Gigaspora rosea]
NQSSRKGINVYPFLFEKNVHNKQNHWNKKGFKRSRVLVSN